MDVTIKIEPINKEINNGTHRVSYTYITRNLDILKENELCSREDITKTVIDLIGDWWVKDHDQLKNYIIENKWNTELGLDIDFLKDYIIKSLNALRNIQIKQKTCSFSVADLDTNMDCCPRLKLLGEVLTDEELIAFNFYRNMSTSPFKINKEVDKSNQDIYIEYLKQLEQTYSDSQEIKDLIKEETNHDLKYNIENDMINDFNKTI